MLRLVMLVTSTVAGASWAAAETIDVKYYGKLDLAPFACTDVTRSSVVNRACYDKTQLFMVVQLRSVYYPYCDMPAATFEAFLAAPSMGNYYNTRSKARALMVPLIAERTDVRSIKAKLATQD